MVKIRPRKFKSNYQKGKSCFENYSAISLRFENCDSTIGKLKRLYRLKSLVTNLRF